LRDVAITGIGVVSALGRGVASHESGLASARTALTPLRLFTAAGIPVAVVGQVPESCLAADPKSSRSDRLAFAALSDAIADAKLVPDQPGVLAVGTTTGGIDLSEQHYLKHRGAIGLEDRDLLRRHPAGAVADRLAFSFGLSGERHTFSTACSSSANAIGYAASLVAAGAPWAVAGGVDALCRLTYCGFYSLKLLSSAACKPFDRTRVGMSLGEAAAFVVLEPKPKAVARGAPIYAEVAGWGCTSDAYHMTSPDPEGRRAAGAMEAALNDAGLSASSVDYINAHGTATPANDAAETTAMRSVFREGMPPTSSTKGATGHTLGAAGALEAVVCALVVSRGYAPPTVGLGEPDPALQINHVTARGLRAPFRVALSNSFGFGGNNASLVLLRGPS
jgi:3-oxoacyl-(acyl-carrier-protein) synthase